MRWPTGRTIRASRELVGELTERSHEFRELWAAQLVKQPTTTAKLFPGYEPFAAWSEDVLSPSSTS